MADNFQVAVAEAKNEFLKFWKEHINQFKDVEVVVARAKNEFLKLWKEQINQLKDSAEGASTEEQKLERIVPLFQEFILAILEAISQGLKDSDDELHN